jgi:hypothetical protein
MRANKYAAACADCGARVPARGGSLRKAGRRWEVRHLSCERGEGRSVAVTFAATGNTIYQNSRGRCIDAPCCGCCS